jgi:hypothetical protein
MSDARTVIAETKISLKVKVGLAPADLELPLGSYNADAILAALAEEGMEIRKSVDMTKHYSWCCLVDTECNCSGRG